MEITYLFTYTYPPPVPILSQLNPVHAPYPTSWRSILYYPPIYARVFQVVSFPHVSPTKTPYIPLPTPYMLHALSISFFLI